MLKVRANRPLNGPPHHDFFGILEDDIMIHSVPLVRCSITLGFLLACFSAARADGPADNVTEKVRPVPAPGVQVPAADLEELNGGLTSLGKLLDDLAKRKDPVAQRHLPDIRIFHKAVSDAIKYNEFFAVGDIAKAKNLLKVGIARAELLSAGDTSWTTPTNGLTVRGYVSKIDGSVQPYGIVLPTSYTHKTASRYRLDVWLHGRGENLSEVNFLDEHLKSPGQFMPNDTIVLHPYGRYCNAFKFAGEVDVFEAIDSTRANYRADDDLTSIRGFSMGGAGVWHLAVHYPSYWFAANPGAGFSETPEFLKVYQNEKVAPTDIEKKLWRMYDCPYYAANVRHCPTVAYSGADDGQKQAADVMEKALEQEGLTLRHILGPGTKHAYHPEAKITVENTLSKIAGLGSRDHFPQRLHFTTQTLKYNHCCWVTIEGVTAHWDAATVQGEYDQNDIVVKTDGVTDLKIEFTPGWCPFPLDVPPGLSVDDQPLDAPKGLSDKSWTCYLHHDENDKWQVGKRPENGLRKQHNLQGPIDDAFMDSFLIVRPTGESQNAAFDQWVKAELPRSISHWRSHFRGEARVKDDKDVSENDIANANLILWGDPKSNQVLAKIADKLPFRWNDQEISSGKQSFSADHHALVMVYPNPLNAKRYVVLNSGFTFRDYDYLNNARQVPKLPDWAVIDLNTPPNSRYPGKVTAADFFDEAWKVK